MDDAPLLPPLLIPSTHGHSEDDDGDGPKNWTSSYITSLRQNASMLSYDAVKNSRPDYNMRKAVGYHLEP